MNLFLLRRVLRARWHLLGCALCLPVLGFAQAPTGLAPVAEPAIDTAASPPGQDKPSDEPAYRFDIELQTESKELREFLLRHMELQRFRALPDLDASELARLVDKAPDNIGELLGTLGHFNPQVEVLGLAQDSAFPLGTLRLKVDPGPLTRVESVLIAFRGEIANRPEAAEQRAAIQNAFSLKAGDRFTQADWASAKTAALRELTARRYPAGRIDGSLADVDPTNHTVRLALELDSGLPVKIGAVRVEGTERYEGSDAEHLVRLAGLVPGSDYDLVNLQEAQRRIETGYYDSVFVYVDPGTDAQIAPVVVQVRESKLKKLVLGIGASTDSGARLSIEHIHNRVPGIGWRAANKLLIERDDQLITTDWTRPVDEQGWGWFVGGQLARQIDGFDTTTSQRLRVGQSQTNPLLDRSFYLQFDRAVSKNSQDATLGSDGAESSLSANYAWTRRRFDDLLQPNDGHGWAGSWARDNAHAHPPSVLSHPRALAGPVAHRLQPGHHRPVHGGSAGRGQAHAGEQQRRPHRLSPRGRCGVGAGRCADSRDPAVPHRRRQQRARLRPARDRHPPVRRRRAARALPGRRQPGVATPPGAQGSTHAV